MANVFFISSNTPSSKNSKQWTGSMLINSKTVRNWQRISKGDWLSQKIAFKNLIKDLPKPVFIHMTFVRGSRRRFDYVNPCQTVLDEMKHYKWIEDDNTDEVVPLFGRYSYDKKKPGVYIRILSAKPQYDFL